MDGCISHIQRFSLHDGPGVRTTVFFIGCPMRCFWCHNPETWEAVPSLAYTAGKCLHCLDCTRACHTGALSETPDNRLAWAPSGCTRCFKCSGECPAGALVVNGYFIGAAELVKELEQDIGMYAKTGGGVTFSGGEPTIQSGFLRELLISCKERGMSAAIDTCGLCDGDLFVDICKLADIVLFDLKHMDDEQHRRLTGTSNQEVLMNARRLAGIGARIHIRVPIVPGYNDSEANIDDTIQFIASLGNVESVTFLGYHKLGLAKINCFFRQADPGVKLPERENMRAICQRMKAAAPDIPASYR